MNTTFFTSSYIKDLDRAVWMRKSINRFLKDPCLHYIAVPKSDKSAFEGRFHDDKSVIIVCQNDAVDKIFYPDLMHGLVKMFVPSQLWRFKSHAGRAGWIVQQIAKLNCTQWIDEGAVVFVDSDVIFTRNFYLKDLGINGSTKTLVRLTPNDEDSKHRDHLKIARKILSLPDGETEHHYLSNPAIWYVDCIKALQQYIKKIHKLDWQAALYNSGHLSEFTLYGTFIEEVLKPKNMAVNGNAFHGGAWDRAAFSQMKLDLSRKLEHKNQPLVMVIQSNLDIPVSEYDDMLEELINTPD